MSHQKIIVFTFAISLVTTACGARMLGAESGTDSSGTEDTGSEPTSTSTSTSMTDPDPSDTGTSDESTTSPGFVPDEQPSGTMCDPWTQDCPEGEKCVPYSTSGDTWDALKCVPILGEQALGEACEYAGAVDATDDCDATSLCWKVDGDGVGVCHAFCSGTPDAPTCPTNSQCLISGSGVINLCIPGCSPLLQDCLPGDGCYWTGNDFSCHPSSRSIPTGQPCEFINDCAVGHVCVGADELPDCAGQSCCAAFCDLDEGDSPCESVLPGTVCVEFFADPLPDHANVGYCVAP